MPPQPRAARWSRVSSAKQATSDREGLPYQIDAQNRALAALDATDTHIAWTVTHSGGSVHQTPEWTDLIVRAGTDFDVLIVAYTSRLGRNAEEVLRAVRLIGEAGASVYFSEEGCHTADEPSWETFAREAVEAESYRRRLSRTMRRTYESRWRRRGLPGGSPPLGYTADHQIDPDAASVIRSLYERYALGDISQQNLAQQHDLEPERVKEILRNQTYLGLAGRHGEWIEAAYPAIISPELFARVASVRQERHRAGGPPTRAPSMLQRRLWCVCGTHIRLDGRDGALQPRVRHSRPLCDAWGKRERRQARYFTQPLTTALSQIQLTDSEIERMVANARQPRVALPRPINWTRRRKALRDAYDAGTLTEGDYIAQGAALRAEEAAQQPPQPTPDLDDATLRAVLVDFRVTIKRANTMPYREDFWAQVISRYFDRIEYVSPDHLRPIPSEAGLAALVADSLPAKVVLARPEGFEPPTC